MALILNLESSTEICSVALSRDGEPVDFLESDEGQNHARLLSVFAQELMQRNQLKFDQLDAVAVSSGPGSYTGLRIGVSLAKGICYANQIPLIAISPLQAMSAHVLAQRQALGLPDSHELILCPMIDARRMEVYTARFNERLEELHPVSAEIIDENIFSELEHQIPVVYFGNGAAKCQPVVNRPNTWFVDDIRTSAQFMCSLSHKAFENKVFEDLAYYEPFYLKDFIAGISQKNLLKPSH
ncbi:tRNA (adenosine(37)-N6)-threonylcarbamoyltransferase complex dimerization subunit type 1 TsaB [Prolixibacteraceae bacterium A06]|uniref:tRNA (Adenosine(37)-N6)-threonylcarbamoyltransferase complex dimerization subunit type 1 TsaB n=2 Tax=Gaoshiqia sediminis TaxID=2986998 RepID=A0AA41YC95_9BACT|nr:tRNA (adenosine(37)-N6)-threonylcarbamoyltransferase complex dimerization subunit type 1 TsaB [Gaoshiqia sediminis]